MRLVIASMGLLAASVAASGLVSWQGQPSVELKNAAKPGVMMPVVGLGTGGYRHGPGNPRTEEWNDTSAVAPTAKWLELGGRRIDTADTYGDEGGIARGIADSGLDRSEFFITSKTGPGKPLGYQDTLDQIDWLLGRLNTTYVDLLLIHWPGATGRPANSSDPACDGPHADPRKCRQNTWRAMETAFQAGKARAIGVSNFEQRHMQDVLDLGSLVPAVNQVEFHPFWHEDGLVAFCQQRGILLNGYAPYGAPDLFRFTPAMFDEPAIKAVAASHGVSPAQAVLRWEVQQGLVVNPRSMDPAHMAENLSIWNFTLTDSEMASLSALKPSAGQKPKICPDPSSIP